MGGYVAGKGFGIASTVAGYLDSMLGDTAKNLLTGSENFLSGENIDLNPKVFFISFLLILEVRPSLQAFAHIGMIRVSPERFRGVPGSLNVLKGQGKNHTFQCTSYFLLGSR
jgi:hypothetical protein